MKYLFITTLIIMSLTYSKMMAQEKQKVSRKDLMTALLTKQEVSNIEIKEVTMPVKCIADLHLHPCPVVGYIVSGIALYQEEGKDSIILNKGDAFYEPKNKTILHFNNFSDTEPLVFIAIYLKEADEDLISIL